jgi:FkbM family methyltransferase
MLTPPAPIRRAAAYCRYAATVMSVARSPLSVVPMLVGRSEAPVDFRVGKLTLAARRMDLVAVTESAGGEYGFLRHITAADANPLILDLGANIGCFAATAFSIWPGAEVHSVEPSPDTFAVLSDNRRRHPRLAWHTHRLAIAAVDGTLAFLNHGPSTARQLSKSGADVTVMAQTLDGFLARVAAGRRVFVCKMDVEGAEHAIFGGELPALDLIDHFVLELHGPDDAAARATRERLSAAFPHVTTLPRSGSSKPLIHAWR